MDAITIQNQALVIERFGYWPSFHDAEVEGVYLKRNKPGGWPTISLWLDLVDPVISSASESKDSNLWRVELEFTEVLDNELEGFNHQNVLFSLSFQTEEDYINCLLETSYGLSGSISARYIAVKSLTIVGKPDTK